MSQTVRAKFRCTNRTTTQYGATAEAAWVSYTFEAMYDPNVPEDQRFAKATPVGKLTMNVDNPAVSFEPGKSYYLDFAPAD
jgi:hypothetical protein